MIYDCHPLGNDFKIDNLSSSRWGFYLPSMAIIHAHPFICSIMIFPASATLQKTDRKARVDHKVRFGLQDIDVLV